MKRYLCKYQISLPTCFYYCSTELQFLTVAGMLSRDTLPMDISAKYFDGSSYLLQKAPQVLGRKLGGGGGMNYGRTGVCHFGS